MNGENDKARANSASQDVEFAVSPMGIELGGESLGSAVGGDTIINCTH
jgi:hypothetical protein